LRDTANLDGTVGMSAFATLESLGCPSREKFLVQIVSLTLRNGECQISETYQPINNS